MSKSTPSESDLLTALAQAKTTVEQTALISQLEEVRAAARAKAEQARLSSLVAPTLSRLSTDGVESTLHRSSAASDWLGDIEVPTVDRSEMEHTMRAQATVWLERRPAVVRADGAEFRTQAKSKANYLSNRYPGLRTEAAQAFLDQVQHLAAEDWARPGDDDVTVPKAESHDPVEFDGDASTDEDTEISASDTPSLSEGTEPESDKPMTGDGHVPMDDASLNAATDRYDGDSTVASRKTASFEVGQEVEYQVMGNGPWVGGTITSIRPDGLIEVTNPNSGAKVYREQGSEFWSAESGGGIRAKASRKTAASDSPVSGYTNTSGQPEVLSRACALGEAGFECDGSLSDGGDCECICHVEWDGEEDLAAFHERMNVYFTTGDPGYPHRAEKGLMWGRFASRKTSSRKTANKTVALVYERGSDDVYDRTYNWESAQSYVLEGYVAVAVDGDGGRSRDEIQAMLDSDMAAYEDLWGAPKWRPSDLFGSTLSRRNTAAWGGVAGVKRNRSASRKKGSRKTTRFEFCDAHQGYFSGDSKRRVAETFVEGGPGSGGPCSPDLCKVFPGTDYYNESSLEEVASAPATWGVNSNRSASRKTAAQFSSFDELEKHVRGLMAQHPDLVDAAEAAYGRQDQSWFDAQDTETLKTLWEIAASSFFVSWDDEVYEALVDRPGNGFVAASRRTAETKGSSRRRQAAMPDIDAIMRYEQGEMDQDEVVTLFQGLVDSGMAWRLQGSYGRMAQSLIDAGLVTTGSRKTAINADNLSREVDFDSPFSVDSQGNVETHVSGYYAPEVYHIDASAPNDVEIGSSDWEAWSTGRSGQHGYRGAVMHASEQLAGGIARDLLSEPGVYVLTTVEDLDDMDNPAGWIVLKHRNATVGRRRKSARTRKVAKASFDEWMAKVDAVCQRKVGLSIHDLADLPFRDYYDDGMTPSAVVSQALREEGYFGSRETDKTASQKLVCGSCGHTWNSRAQYRIKCPKCGAEESVRRASRKTASRKVAWGQSRTEGEFNGWTNWDTWNASLWINNEEGIYRAALETNSPQELRDLVEDIGLTGDGFDVDKVNWDEVWTDSEFGSGY